MGRFVLVMTAFVSGSPMIHCHPDLAYFLKTALDAFLPPTPPFLMPLFSSKFISSFPPPASVFRKEENRLVRETYILKSSEGLPGSLNSKCFVYKMSSSGVLLSETQHWEGEEKPAAVSPSPHCLVTHENSGPWPAEMEAMLC